MHASSHETPLLDEATASFISSGVSIAIASRDAGNRPSVARAWGCRVSPDRRCVYVFVSPMQSSPLLADLRAGHPVAAVFSLPSSHRTLQLKAARAEVAPCDDADRRSITEYVNHFPRELERVGYGGGFASAYLHVATGLLVRVGFEPTEAFAQTPGPGAGEPLRS